MVAGEPLHLAAKADFAAAIAISVQLQAAEPVNAAIFDARADSLTPRIALRKLGECVAGTDERSIPVSKRLDEKISVDLVLLTTELVPGAVTETRFNVDLMFVVLLPSYMYTEMGAARHAERVDEELATLPS